MALPMTALEPSKLMQSLDFEGKGLIHPTLIGHSREGKDSRLVLKAVFKGPRAGWPLLDRKKIHDIALKTTDNKEAGTANTIVLGDGNVNDQAFKNNVPICVADLEVAFPIPVIIRIALITQPGACDDMLKVGRAYSQLYANDYIPFELPLAMWRTVEGIWSVTMDESPVSLMDWWELHVQPPIQASESRWKIGSWRRKSEDLDAEGTASIVADLQDRHCEEQQEEKKRIHFVEEASAEIKGLLQTKEQLAQTDAKAANEKVKSQQDKVADSISKKTEKMIAENTSAEEETPHTVAEQAEISDSRKQEWAARIHRQKEGIHPSNTIEKAEVSEEILEAVPPVTKPIGVDEDEAEVMVIDKGWLPAVDVLIQLADIMLSLHERRLCMVVCRPEFFTVFESRPFVSRSGIPSEVQPISLQLIHLGSVVQMPGYDGGKLVGHMNSDFDGDKVLAMGPGSASAFTNFGSTATAGDEEGWMVGEDEGVGALKGVLDEASILRHLQFIAPEAISSNKAIASTVDIFSWGMTAYELLKGKGQEGTESDDDKAEFFRAIHLHSTRTMPTLTSLCPSMPPELSALIKKALALDPDDRYSNFCALLHDLHKVKQICEGTLRGPARRDFIVGHIDYQSRFAIPPGLLDREGEFAMLDEAYRLVKTTGQSQVACAFGVSGSGKSKLLELWARKKEADNAGQDCFVSWAKMDQHLVKPLSAFISVFCSLLERVFSDPLESASDWRQKILDSLAVNANVFLALLPKEWRAILLDGQESDEMDSDMTAGIDWESWVKQFRTWSYGLLRLFASEARPLLVIIDDVQWLEKSERELWEELITSQTRRLDHCLILFSYRTQDDTAPDISPFVPKYMIQTRPFSEATLGEMIHRCFHLEDVAPTLPQQWAQLSSYLYKNTKGNPFDLKWTLSTLVRDGDIYYDYVQQKWNIRTAVLNAYPDVSAEEFAASVLNSLSQPARVVLCHLACLPSRGVEIALLAHLVNKTEGTVRTLLDECATLGSVVIRNTKVQFVHDKPHTAALGLIDLQEKPRLFAKIARKLEGLSTDYNFVRADMLLSAYHSDPQLLEVHEVVKAAVRAARQAAASAALDLASSYLEQCFALWSYDTPQAWERERDLTLDLVTVSAEVALGRRTAAAEIARVTRARDSAPKLYTKLEIAIWLFKLQLSASRPDLALKSFFDVIRLLGYDTPAETHKYPPPPSDESEIRDIANSPPPPDSEESKVAISLSNLVGTAGPTFYSYEADQGWRIMHFVIPIYLHNHAATKHSATAYSWYVMAILLANGELESLGRARAYIDLGDSYNLVGSPLEAIAETAKVTLGYIRTTSLKTIDYSRSYQVCLATKNYDVLSYTLGLDLSAQALSGHSVAELYTAGRNTLVKLADDLQPAIRLMTVPFIEFGAHLMDVNLLKSKTDFSALNVLEGEYVTPQDAKDLSNSASFYTAVYATASLFLGLLFQASPEDLRERADLVEANRNGGSGTILGTFCFILLSITTLVLDGQTDEELLKHTYSWLYALPHNEDFQSGIRMLKALEAIKAVRLAGSHWREMMDAIEEALEALENAQSYLFTGLLCMKAADALQNKPYTSRNRRTLLQHAKLAFGACDATNLVLFVDVLLTQLPQSALIMKRDEKNSMTESSTTALSEGFLSHEVGSVDGSENLNKSERRESDLSKQKLGLESILRSFLILASEKDSDGLIRRVLQVLLQVTCTSYACFATQDSASASLKLKGYGTYDDIKLCNVPIAEAKQIAPTVLLSHCSITKKPINAGNISSTVNANLLRREPFFAATGPPKTLLSLPLFVQGRFSGLLFLSGKVPNGHPATSQVGLLATFAAIILESNQAYATLESAVEMRTQQLQHALHSRSTFISGVSHEIRTPLFAITGLCSVMESSADLTDTQRENLQVISQSADDLQRIVTAVLDWSKLDAQSISPETIPFDLRSSIENALETVAHLARSKNIELLLENPVSTDPPMALLGDPHRYRQCLLNLLSNAIKFTKAAMPNQHSTVSVSWSWQDHPDKVEITCAVKDEGIGIPAKSMNRLFHAFSQVDSGISRQFGGSGLGLSITRGLARLLGGDCWAESVEGQGSTFYLLVAAAKAPQSGDERPLVYPRGPPRQAVLYAPACLASSVLQANLRDFGITATLFDIEEPKCIPGPDFVFVDVDDSRITAGVLQALRIRHEGSKFIFLVTLTDVSKLVNSLALNQEAIVTKPLKANSLYNTTKNLDASSNGSALKAAKKVSAMDSSYAKKYPLKICYIDDSSVNVAVGKKILSKFGYKNIDVCYDGNQAVEAAERTRYDLMLMDLQMPNMDGHTARKLISENDRCGNPMVVALTANCDQPTKDRCLREGFADFLTKPLIISDLAKLLVKAYEMRNEVGE